MLAVISPAKTLDYKSTTPEHPITPIRFPKEAAALVDRMREFTAADIRALMGVSENIAQENVERFSTWTWPYPDSTARAALFAFKGDVYTGLDAYSLSSREQDYVNRHVRILSGLYGLLRPSDAILPYRLEMGKKVGIGGANDLYSFWGHKIANLLADDMAEVGSNTLVNLASTEYFRSVAPHVKQHRVITPVFKDWKNGQYKVISFFAKRARGRMVRYMAEQQVTLPDQLKAFDGEGYAYSAEQSSDKEWVFLRKQAE